MMRRQSSQPTATGHLAARSWVSVMASRAETVNKDDKLTMQTQEEH